MTSFTHWMYDCRIFIQSASFMISYMFWCDLTILLLSQLLSQFSPTFTYPPGSAWIQSLDEKMNANKEIVRRSIEDTSLPMNFYCAFNAVSENNIDQFFTWIGQHANGLLCCAIYNNKNVRIPGRHRGSVGRAPVTDIEGPRFIQLVREIPQKLC